MNPAILILAGAGLIAFGAIKGGVRLDLLGGGGGTTNEGNGVELRYFSPWEFGDWWSDMSPALLRKLDAFRQAWGHPVQISPVEGALGRHQGAGGASQHNIDRWGEVRAVDVFPKVPAGGAGYRYMQTAAERERAYQVAREVGFTGIGLYTDTKPGNMLHLDVRPGGHVATWSRVEGDYLDIGQVIA